MKRLIVAVVGVALAAGALAAPEIRAVQLDLARQKLGGSRSRATATGWSVSLTGHRNCFQ